MKKSKLFFLTALAISVSMLSGCASSRRLERVSQENALQRKSIAANADTINLWPFFLGGKDYVSVMWPLFDADPHGMALRPLFNIEDGEVAVLFPLVGFNPNNKNGWCAVGYWNVKQKYCGIFPLFHYNGCPGGFNYYGPVWYASGDVVGFFPFYWQTADDVLMLPLVYIKNQPEDQKVLSIPVSWCNVICTWPAWNRYSLPVGCDGAVMELENFRMYALLYYQGRNKFRVIDRNAPGWEYWWQYAMAQYAMAQYEDGSEALEKKMTELSKEADETWYGVFPFYHSVYFRDASRWNVLFGLLASGEFTPEKESLRIYPLLFAKNQERHTGEFPVDARSSDSLFAFLYWNSNSASKHRTGNARVKYRDLDDVFLRERKYLKTPDQIKRWENNFYNRLGLSAESDWKGWKCSVAVPKSAEEAEALLKQIKVPENYAEKIEKTSAVFPFWYRSQKTDENWFENKSLWLCGLAAYDKQTPDKHFWHILGPFGFLHDEERINKENYNIFELSWLYYHRDIMEQGKETRTWCVVPFYRMKTSPDSWQRDILLGILSRQRHSPDEDYLHILGELGYQRRDVHRDSVVKGVQNTRRERASLFFQTQKADFVTWNDDLKKQAGFMGYTDYVLRSSDALIFDDQRLEGRLRLKDAKKIRRWERDFSFDARKASPDAPLATPKNEKEVRDLIAKLSAPESCTKKFRYTFSFPFLFSLEDRDDGFVYRYPFVRLSKDPNGHCEEVFSLLYKNEDRINGQVESHTFARGFYYRKDEIRKDKRTDAAEKKYAGISLLNELLKMEDEPDPQIVARWKRDFERNVWMCNPESDIKAPATEDEALALYNAIHYNKANFRTTLRHTTGFFPFFETETYDGHQPSWKILEGLLAEKKVDDTGNDSTLSVLGLLYREETDFTKGCFPHDNRNDIERWAGLLFYCGSEKRFVPTEEKRQKYRPVTDSAVCRFIERPENQKQKKADRENWERLSLKVDGTYAVPYPKDEAEARKVYLAANDSSLYQENTCKWHGFFPLYHYGSDTLGTRSKFVFPLLLSWYGCDSVYSHGYLLCGLLHYGKTYHGKSPASVVFADELPYVYSISPRQFLNGNVDIENVAFDYTKNRTLLCFTCNKGQAVVWKDKTPLAVMDLYRELCWYSDPNQKKEELFQRELKELNWEPVNLKDAAARVKLCKKILDTYAETVPLYERGRLGKMLFRYAEYKNDAAMWLGWGLLARYDRYENGTAEDCTILGYLYRSHSDPQMKSKMFFPFIKTVETKEKTQFSFLWRLVNLETAKDGTRSGYICFIPFGK